MRGNKQYVIEYIDTVVKVDIPAITKRIKKTIQNAIEERLTIDPIGFGKPLRYSLKGYRRLRVGDYRNVYNIDAQRHVVLIVAIKHRKDIYDDMTS